MASVKVFLITWEDCRRCARSAGEFELPTGTLLQGIDLFLEGSLFARISFTPGSPSAALTGLDDDAEG